MDIFADPNARQVTKLAYEHFLREGSGRFNIRDSVQQSWQRCREQQVSPALNGASAVVDGSHFQELQWQNRLLLEAAAPVLNDAKNQLFPANCMLALTDAKGCILKTEGSHNVIQNAEGIALMQGAPWAETQCGTNGIGTALAAQAPIQIHADEHFCEGMKQWSCSAAVIYYPGHRYILGALDVSALSKHHNKQHLLQAIKWAKQIESQVYEQEFSLRHCLQDAFLRRLDKSPKSHHAVLDRFGHVLQTTPNFQQALQEFGQKNREFLQYLRRRNNESLLQYQLRLANEGATYGINDSEDVRYQDENIGFVISLDKPAQTIAMPAEHREKTQQQTTPTIVTGKSHAALDAIVGNSRDLVKVCRQAERVAQGWSPVLVSGETGTGKELFARALHAMGPTKDGAFMALNCGAFSRELFNSELFGYKEGAFTGARKGGMVGKIEAAHNGTLFLDEIGEMPLELQPQLLRVLGTGEFYRLGENQVRISKFRLIAATNRDLREEVAQKRFRSDLFYRLSVCHLVLPPLRARNGDIELLIEHFLKQLSQQYNKNFSLTPSLQSRLAQAPWQGNVRELLNVLEYMVLLSDSETISEHALPQYLQTELNVTVADEFESKPPSAQAGLAHSEEACIRQSIVQCQGILTHVANDLGIAKSTLYAKVKKYALQEFINQIREQTS